MRNYFIGFFHIAILTFLGCGYKAPPKWDLQEVKVKDVKLIDINGTLKLDIGIK